MTPTIPIGKTPQRLTKVLKANEKANPKAKENLLPKILQLVMSKVLAARSVAVCYIKQTFVHLTKPQEKAKALTSLSALPLPMVLYTTHLPRRHHNTCYLQDILFQDYPTFAQHKVLFNNHCIRNLRTNHVLNILCNTATIT